MRSRLSVLAAAVLAVLVLVAALASCGGGSPATGRISGRTLTIYSSLAKQGQWSSQALAVEQGAQLALDEVHSRIGRYRIAFAVLDDSTAQAGTWVPGLVANNARQAAADRTTIGYLGEFNPDASAISIPVLNRAGIPQISPADGAAGLTAATVGAFPGEPEKYYPTGRRTFARVVPSDSAEAVAQVRLQQSLGCTKTFVLDDGGSDNVYGADLASIFQHDAAQTGLMIAGAESYDPAAASYSSVASTIAATGADCVLLSASLENNAAALAAALGTALPAAKIFAVDGIANDAFLNPAHGGIPLSLDPRVYITLAPVSERAYPPASRGFFTAYTLAYGAVQPYAIFGYAAMSLMLRAIDRATHHGRRVADRAQVLAAIFATRNRRSVLGTYSIATNGDTTIRRYGAYGVHDWRLIFLHTLKG